MHSIHGTLRPTQGFLLTKNRPLPAGASLSLCLINKLGSQQGVRDFSPCIRHHIFTHETVYHHHVSLQRHVIIAVESAGVHRYQIAGLENYVAYSRLIQRFDKIQPDDRKLFLSGSVVQSVLPEHLRDLR